MLKSIEFDSAVAVVRGALMKGLNEVRPTLASIKVASRAARMHYGTESSVPFDPEIHDEKKKYVHVDHHDRQASGALKILSRFLDDASGQFKVVGMDWFIKKVLVLQKSKNKASIN